MNNLPLPRFGVFLLIALALPAATRNAIPSSAKAILERADHLDVLSLDPGRKTVVAAFERAVEENQGDMAVCFNPRHGLRVSRGDKQVDFVICFHCLQVRVYGETESEFLVSASAAAAFDDALGLNDPSWPTSSYPLGP